MGGVAELLLLGRQSPPLCLFGLPERLGPLCAGTVRVKGTLGSGENVNLTLGTLFLFSGLCPSLKTKCVGERESVVIGF